MGLQQSIILLYSNRQEFYLLLSCKYRTVPKKCYPLNNLNCFTVRLSASKYFLKPSFKKFSPLLFKKIFTFIYI